MTSVTFPTTIGGDGSTVSDDSNASTGLAGGGHRTRFVPALAQVVAVASTLTNRILTLSDTSTTSNTVGTGSKTFTTAKVYTFALGQWVVISSTASPTNYMYGQVTSYTSGTGALVVNVTAIAGSGTLAAWTISCSVASGAHILKAGDTMTGALNVPAGASGTQVPQAQEAVLKTGGTMTGDLNLPSLNGGQLAGMRNRLINGEMLIDQRSSGSAVTPTSGTSQYTLDRWLLIYTVASKLTVAQRDGYFTLASNYEAASTPAGFQYSLKVTNAAASYALLASDTFYLRQAIEPSNFADFAWGTAAAETVVLSFWVKSSVTGTFGGALRDSGGFRAYPFTYSIATANTWQLISVVVPGDTGGQWTTIANNTLQVVFGLGVGTSLSGTAGAWASVGYASATGAVNLLATASATFYVTGIQLELGNKATPYEHLPMGLVQLLCQRYFQRLNTLLVGGNTSAGGTVYCDFWLPVPMRATPTGSLSGTPTYSNASGYAINSSFSEWIRLSLVISAAGYGYGISGVILTAEI